MISKTSKRVLVIGGAGYIGTHTAVALAEAGYQPIIVDNFSNSYPKAYEGLQRILGTAPPLYTADASEVAAVAEVCKKHAPLYGVIHFAALKSVSESVAAPLAYYRNNLSTLWAVLAVAPARVVFSSSCSVYGGSNTPPLHEDMPLGVPSSPYGYTKQVCEHMLQDCCHSSAVRGVSLRYFNPIGAHPSAHIGEWARGAAPNLVPSVLGAMHRGESFAIYGRDYPTEDGSCQRDYMHVMDLAECHVAALRWLDTQPPSSYEVFNCGTGRAHSVLEIVSMAEKICKKKLTTHTAPRRPGDLPVVYAQVDKATTQLSWSCARSVETALEDAWRWQQNLPTYPST